MRHALAALLLGACTVAQGGGGGGDGVDDAGGGSDSGSDGVPGEPARVEVVLDDLQPGWRVTTSRLAGQTMPSEETIISDGTPITLIGTEADVFNATITDASGALIANRAMHAPCTLAAQRRLDVPADHATIQAAIDAADPGDTVWVAAGTYTESVRLRAGVCLRGQGARRTILDAQGEARTLIDLSDAPGSAVIGFTIRGTRHPYGGCADDDVFTCSGDWYAAGIYLGGSSWVDATQHAPPLIANNVIADNQMGVMLYWHGIAIVRNNLFTGNTSAFIANHYQDRTLIANNVFVDNTELAIGNQAAYLDIIDNVIVGSQVGIRFQYIQTGFIACNLFHDNGANTNDGSRFAIGTDGNLEAEPRFVGNGDVHLDPSSPGKDAGCHQGHAFEPDGSAPDLGAYGGPLAAFADL